MDSSGGAASELRDVRVEGDHRRIAMREADWDLLRTQVPAATYLRLMAAFKRFCAGCDNLPDRVFRRCADSGYGRLEEFVADGILVIGRRGTDDRFQTFFITEVRIDAAAAMPAQELVVPRQAQLPLDVGTKQKGQER